MVSDACNCVLGSCCHYWVWVWVVILKCWHQLFTSACTDCCSCFYKYFVIGVASFVRCTVMQSDEKSCMFSGVLLNTWRTAGTFYALGCGDVPMQSCFTTQLTGESKKEERSWTFPFLPTRATPWRWRVRMMQRQAGQSSVGSDGRSH